MRAMSQKLMMGVALFATLALAGCASPAASSINLAVGEWHQDGASAAPSSIGDFTLLTRETKEQHGLECEGDPLRGWHMADGSFSELYVHKDAWESLREWDDYWCDGGWAITSAAKGGIVQVDWTHESGEHTSQPACGSIGINVGCSNYFYGGTMHVSVRTPVDGGDEAALLAFVEAFYWAYTGAFPNIH